ncbi:hypothetical protein F5876DRAFT_70541 [Lentinula aff. lateritia]|uniref:Uncharacterized protein n=1 Tax=Lentinula aff. lateritia TaxID=2804960 RepID=A0ACC1TIF8_9AGAR|nr:hypothetical protein F5876DRAFT_70541 [Lentinula aff. lateritia]
MSVLLKQLSLLLFLFFSFSSFSNLPTPDHSESIDNKFGIIIVHCMSDPLQCAPECKRAWNTYVAAQALKRGYEEASSSAVTLKQSKGPEIGTAEHPTLRALLSPEPNSLVYIGIDGEPDEPELAPEMTAAARYLDVLPQSAPAVGSSQTQLNVFGLWHEYPDQPSHDPDGKVGLEDLLNLPRSEEYRDDEHSEDARDDSPLNPTQTLLAGWQNNGNSTKSNSEMDGLTRILQRPDFDVKELKGYNAQAANEKITKADEDWEYN